MRRDMAGSINGIFDHAQPVTPMWTKWIMATEEFVSLVECKTCKNWILREDKENCSECVTRGED